MMPNGKRYHHSAVKHSMSGISCTIIMPLGLVRHLNTKKAFFVNCAKKQLHSMYTKTIISPNPIVMVVHLRRARAHGNHLSNGFIKCVDAAAMLARMTMQTGRDHDIAKWAIAESFSSMQPSPKGRSNNRAISRLTTSTHSKNIRTLSGH